MVVLFASGWGAVGKVGILPAAAPLDCFSAQALTTFRCCFPMELEFLFFLSTSAACPEGLLICVTLIPTSFEKAF